MKRIKGKLLWLVMNSGLAWCVWAGINGNTGAGNIAIFIIWFFAIIYWLGAMLPKESLDDIRLQGRSIPAWLSHCFDIALTLFLVWNSWWATAVGVVIMSIGEAALFAKKKEVGIT